MALATIKILVRGEDSDGRVCTPAGFEPEFARRAARSAGTEPPAWAMQPVPEVRYVGPRIGETRV
jgi:hypothetical protein